MGLDLDIDFSGLDGLGLSVPPAKGRRAAELGVSYVRDLDEADVLVLIQNPSRDVTTPSVKRLKTSHHNLARLIAEGHTHTDAALITGYSVSRISILMHDPAFTELLTYYASQTEEIYLNVHQRLASVGLDALEELQHRLENNPDNFSVKELLDTLSATMDRGGYGPKSTVVHQEGGGVSELLSAIKAEVANRNNVNIKTLDVAARRAEDNTGPELGSTTEREAEQYSGLAPQGDQGQGGPVREASGQDAGQRSGSARPLVPELSLVLLRGQGGEGPGGS